jgi:hypothetical protein
MVEQIDTEDVTAYVLPSERLRVYVACSLTSDDRTGLRDRLLDAVETVLTKHGFDVYNPSRYTKPGSPHRDDEVTAIDHLQAMRCDFIFFIREQPSLGMGIEAQIAADVLIPWADAKISAVFLKPCPLLAGLANGLAILRLNFSEENLDEFSEQLGQRLLDTEIRDHLYRAQRARAIATETIRQVGIGRMIRQQRLLLNMSTEQLAALIDLAPWWVNSIETDPELTNCLTFMQLMRLVDAARLRFVIDEPYLQQLGFPRLAPVDSFDPRLIAAAEEFADYSLRSRLLGEPGADTDGEMLAHWAKWLREAKGLEIPAQPLNSLEPVSDLSVFVAMPMSNIGAEEKKREEAVVSGVKDALARIRTVPVRVVEPEFRPSGREDFGPEIYLATISRLHQCDFGIAYVTPPATGVGVIARLFANVTMPCFSLAESGKRVSRMFLGMYCRHLHQIMEFKSTDEVTGRMESAVADHLVGLCESAARRRQTRDRISQTRVASAVERFRIPQGLSFDKAVERVKNVELVRDDWFDKFVRDPAILPTVTLLQFVYMANQLRWHIGVSASGVPCYLPPCALDLSVTNDRRETATKSLDGLLAAREIGTARGALPPDDQTLFDAWGNYVRELLTEESYPVRSAEDWLESLRLSPIKPSTAPVAKTQRLLPGIQEPDELQSIGAAKHHTDVGAAVLYLLGIANRGLPPYVISRAVGASVEVVESVMASEIERGDLIADDGVWRANTNGDVQVPDGSADLVHRALDALLDCVQFDSQTEYGRHLLENAPLLVRAAQPLPAVLTARVRLLQGRVSEAHDIMRTQMKDVQTSDSLEYVGLLILLGWAASSLQEASGYLDEAIETCDRVLAETSGRDGCWKEVAARARLVMGAVCQKWDARNASYHLSRASELWRSVGNHFTASVAEWRLQVTQQHVPERQYERLSRESPQLRVEAVRLYKAKKESSGAKVLARRAEPDDRQWQEFIREARARCSRKPEST